MLSNALETNFRSRYAVVRDLCQILCNLATFQKIAVNMVFGVTTAILP